MSLEKDIRNTTSCFLECKDYLATKDTFEILKNDSFNILFTSPVPNNLEEYYKGDDYLSHNDKSKGFISFLYRKARNQALSKKEKLAASYNLPKKILDIGSGIGLFVNHCQKKDWNAIGIEPNLTARNVAASRNIKLLNSLDDVTENNFSIITLWHVLEHIPNLSDTLEIIKKKLHTDGRLFVAVPNFESFDAEHYGKFWAGYDVPRHLWHFSKKGIAKVFDTIDMEVEKILPMKLDSYYVSLLSEKYKTGKNRILKAFMNGFISNRKARAKNNYSSLIYILKHKE